MRLPPADKRRGFTIVELLVVIVVIAILASVSVAAFNGVSKRATNSSIMSALEHSEKALRAYKVLEDKPLYMSEESLAAHGLSGNQYYLGDNGMKGACLGGDWPTPIQMADIMSPEGGSWAHAIAQGNEPEYMYWYFCSHFMNTPYAIALADTIKSSKAAGYFAKMPTISPVTVVANNTNGTTSEFTQRGIRYGFNGSTTAPISYLYYGINGKTCLPGDTSVRFGSTNAPGVGPGGSWPGFSETGGDYTSNDTQYCYRTFVW